MKAWGQNTSAFRLIGTLAVLRTNSPAIWRGNYTTLYAKDDVLIYERIDGRDVVLVAVNRGSGIDVTLNLRVFIAASSPTRVPQTLVERWFAELTNKRIRRGVFRSVKELEAAIREYIDVHNEDPKPFVWTKTADQILASIARYAQRTTAAQASNL